MGYVFISYSSKNAEVATQMLNILNDNKIKCWMAPNDIPVGMEYPDVITLAIRDCSCLVLLLTNSSMNSVWVKREVERAITYKKPIITVQLEQITLSNGFELFLSTHQMVSVNNISKDSEEIKQIIKSVNLFICDGSSCVKNVPYENISSSNDANTLKGSINKLIKYLQMFRTSLRNANRADIIQAMNNISNTIQNIYELYEIKRYSVPELSQIAFDICSFYNTKYISAFNSWNENRTNAAAITFENIFKEFLDFLLKTEAELVY